MLNSKIIVGIVVGIIVIIGAGYVASNTENIGNVSVDVIQPTEQITDNTEGQRFVLELDDSVSAIGP